MSNILGQSWIWGPFSGPYGVRIIQVLWYMPCMREHQYQNDPYPGVCHMSSNTSCGFWGAMDTFLYSSIPYMQMRVCIQQHGPFPCVHRLDWRVFEVCFFTAYCLQFSSPGGSQGAYRTLCKILIALLSTPLILEDQDGYWLLGIHRAIEACLGCGCLQRHANSCWPILCVHISFWVFSLGI